MDQRLTDLLSRLRLRFPPSADVAELEAYLSSEGFDRGQIGTIVTAWLVEIGAERAKAPVSAVLRVQGPHEVGRFTKEAWGQLLAMHRDGHLSD